MLSTNVQGTYLILFLFVPNQIKEFINNNELIDKKKKKSSEQKQSTQNDEEAEECNAPKLAQDTQNNAVERFNDGYAKPDRTCPQKEHKNEFEEVNSKNTTKENDDSFKLDTYLDVRDELHQKNRKVMIRHCKKIKHKRNQHMPRVNPGIKDFARKMIPVK